MEAITVFFYEELGDFFQKHSHRIPIKVEILGHETVKHIIETSGIPHTEIGLIIVNGRNVGFDYRPQDSDSIAVYPWRRSPDNQGNNTQLRPSLVSPLKFVLDVHLGKLAGYLRLLGIDTLYQNDFCDVKLAEISRTENRILLTRDRGLLMRKIVTYGYWIREKDPGLQLREVINRFGITSSEEMFSRCSKCNGKLELVPKIEVIELLEPKTKLYYDEFRRCSNCRQIYWKGSHFKKMESFLSEIFNN